MGTSSSYTGPVGPGWNRAKRLARRLARQHGSASPENVVSAYVTALGGAGEAAAGAVAGRTVAQQIALFLAGVHSQGVSEAFRAAGLEHLIGQDTTTVVCGLVDYLAGPGSLLEEAAARKALELLLEELLSQAEEWGELEERLTEAEVSEVLQDFICRYIFVRITQDLGMRLENGSDTPEQLQTTYSQLLDCIRELVKLDLRERNILETDWTSEEGQLLVQGWMEEAYGFLEVESRDNTRNGQDIP